MKYLVGVDGGGSKTKFQCYDLSGRLIGETLTDAADYHQSGIEDVIRIFKSAFKELCVDPDECLVGFGMPAYGEHKTDDENALKKIKNAFPGTLIHVENDVYCAWAGALAFGAGVTVVCGTGSMAVGCDESGGLVRSGGWCEFFSDEGSGYWLGKKALELFSKQSDRRLPKGPLHTLMKEYLDIADDNDINAVISSGYAGSRKKTAALQTVLFEAYRQGDETAAAAYRQAVRELASIVMGAVRQLDFRDQIINVSYIGGLFNEKELFLAPFKRELEKHINANIAAPKLSPCHGAIMFAINKYENDKLDDIIINFLRGQGSS